MGLDLHGHVDCISCMINKYDKVADKHYVSKDDKYIFMRKVMLLILESEKHKTAPYISSKINALMNEEFGIKDPYADEKKYYNDSVLKMKPMILEKLKASDNIFEDTLKYAAAGNIIDFGALSEVTDELVEETIESILKKDLDKDTLIKFKNDLENANTLMYLGDNCGEIIFDSILIETISKLYPNLKIYFGVRGMPILNDVLKEDALFAGIDAFATIVENGTAIPGTDLEEVTPEFKNLMENADLIISKGQGNFETLSNSDLNIYFLFLCKCERIVEALNKELYSLMFLSVQDLK